MEEGSTAYFFLKYKPTLFIVYPLLAFGVGLTLYTTLIFNPQYEAHLQQEKSMIDSLQCQELGKWIIVHSANSTYSSGGYVDRNYPYAEARYLVCTHGGIQP
jgi:hypothetical protein